MNSEDSNSNQPQDPVKGRPVLHFSVPDAIVRTFYRLKPEEIRELPSYNDRTFYVRIARDVIAGHSGRRGQGLLSPFEAPGNEYILKVYNSICTDDKHLEAQHEMMLALNEKAICSPLPVTNIDGRYMSCAKVRVDDQTLVTEDCTEYGNTADNVTEHFVVLLTYIPGHTLKTCAPYSAKLLFRHGRLAGEINRAVQEGSEEQAIEKTVLLSWALSSPAAFPEVGVNVCKHPMLVKRKSNWSLDAVVDLNFFTAAITDDSRRQMIDDVIKAFDEEVVQMKPYLKQGVIHGDLNEDNIIVSCHYSTKKSSSSALSHNLSGGEQGEKDDPVDAVSGGICEDCEVVGIIDFADVAFSLIVYEVAIAMMYVMLDCDDKVVDPVSAGGHVLAGYMSSAGPDGQLNALERSVLPTCIAARLAQTVTLGLHTYSKNPSNKYALRTQKRGWPLLERLWKQSTRDELNRKWNEVIMQYDGLQLSINE